MHSLAIGDLNKDGWLDLYASYGDIYVSPDFQNEDVLWMNDGGDNNWVAFDLQGMESNANAIGAKVQITGDFGIMIREVRAGESYGINNTFHCHFGLGESDNVDQVIVTWPSGIISILDDLDVNMFHDIEEPQCVAYEVEISTGGSTTICPGESVTITAPEGYTYMWNNDMQMQSIEVTEAGSYNVIVVDGNNCAGSSNIINVEVSTPTQPTITVNGDDVFCEGSTVELISSEGNSYDWGGQENTQALVVSETGEYAVSVVDECESALTSESVYIEVIPLPMDAMVENVEIPNNTSIILEGNSENLHWYENENDTDPIFVGEDFETPLLGATTTYYVENINSAGGDEANGGRFDNSGDGQYHFNSARWLEFDAYENMTLVSVVMYAEGEGERTIELLDEFGNAIESITVNLVSGEQNVELNFEVPAGEDYGLRLTDDDPQV
ncbi:MAG: ASPIC/UnbV domain-containing protein, partial [Bacteroidota bacterium]